MLLASTQYYIRAYAVNAEGVLYGDVVSFVTSEPSEPVIRVYPVTELSETSAKILVEIVSSGGLEVQKIGVCLSRLPGVCVSDTVVFAGHPGALIYIGLSGLQTDREYFYKGFILTKAGVVYSEEMKFGG